MKTETEKLINKYLQFGGDKDYKDFEKWWKAVVYDPSKQPLTSKSPVNGNYTAIISSEGTIKVGCQTIAIDAVRNIVKEFDKLVEMKKQTNK